MDENRIEFLARPEPGGRRKSRSGNANGPAKEKYRANPKAAGFLAFSTWVAGSEPGDDRTHAPTMRHLCATYAPWRATLLQHDVRRPDGSSGKHQRIRTEKYQTNPKAAGVLAFFNGHAENQPHPPLVIAGL
jgi:hypothetical protein